MINIGSSLKEHRENANLTQTQLANQTGIKQQNLSRWENNTHVPNVIDCIKLANFYQISIDYLIGYENEDGSKNEIKTNKPQNVNINNSFNNSNNSGTFNF